MNYNIYHFLFCSFLFLSCFSTLAQNNSDVPPFISDRPGIGDSAGLMGVNYIQIETGAGYQNSKSNGINTNQWLINSTLLKYGLFETLELRAAINYEFIETSGPNRFLDDQFTSLSPLSLGLKTRILKGDEKSPAISIIGTVGFPFTVDNNRPPNVLWDAKLILEQSITSKSVIAANLGVFTTGIGSDVNYSYAVSYNLSLADKWAGFIEAYGNFPDNDDSQHLWDAGITYLALPYLQFDFSLGTGIVSDQRLFLNAGLSYRLGKL